MKKLIIISAAVILGLIVILNTSMVADQAMAWVSAHPKDPDAPEILYRAARWCDLLGSGDQAAVVYKKLYENYPDRADLCAPALYYLGSDLANGTYIVGIKKQALPYLGIVMNQYASQKEWCTKAKQLYDEVDAVH